MSTNSSVEENTLELQIKSYWIFPLYYRENRICAITTPENNLQAWYCEFLITCLNRCHLRLLENIAKVQRLYSSVEYA